MLKKRHGHFKIKYSYFTCIYGKKFNFSHSECEQQHATKHSRRFLHCLQLSFAQFFIVPSELFNFAFYQK